MEEDEKSLLSFVSDGRQMCSTAARTLVVSCNLVLENQNKVYIRLRSTQQGAALNFGVDGLTIELKDAIGPSS